MKYIIEPSVTVLTPSIGSRKLLDAVRSVSSQDYRNLRHLVVFDGRADDVTFDMVNELKSVDHILLPYTTGADGFYGHRIYAAFPHLINTDYIFFLDEDNWYEPDHVSSLMEVFTKNPEVRFAFSKRKIYDKDCNYLCDDNCESLGDVPILGMEQNGYLIDTSAYAFKRDFLIQVSQCWHSGWGGDRRFLSIMRTKNVPYTGSGKHTLCYRLDGNPGSVTEDFFTTGNAQMERL